MELASLFLQRGFLRHLDLWRVLTAVYDLLLDSGYDYLLLAGGAVNLDTSHVLRSLKRLLTMKTLELDITHNSRPS